MDLTYLLLLSCLCVAITAQAQDCSTPVAGPNMNLKDKDSLLETFPDGVQVAFACDVGYTSTGGSPVITCTAGTWSPVRLQCQMVSCEPPPVIADGNFRPKKDSYAYRQVVQYRCQKDFTLIGSNTISCSDDGTFDPDPPTCIMVQCEDPDIENANWIQGSRPPHGYRSTVTFKCRSGYTMIGEPTQICEINSQWSPGLPSCKPMTCDPPPMIPGGTFGPSKSSYTYREVVQYSCQKDFTLIGSSSISCSDDGTFRPDPPTCIMVQCEDPVIENADWIQGSRPPHASRSMVTFKCRSGYTMIGEPTQICEINSQGSPGLPSCKRKSNEN